VKTTRACGVSRSSGRSGLSRIRCAEGWLGLAALSRADRATHRDN
jgi:hypothetical protein